MNIFKCDRCGTLYKKEPCISTEFAPTLPDDDDRVVAAHATGMVLNFEQRLRTGQILKHCFATINLCPTCLQQLIDYLEINLLSNVIVAPCKIGDYVYYPHYKTDEGTAIPVIETGVAVNFSINVDLRQVYVVYSTTLRMWHNFDDFGQTVFLDVASAQQSLKKL